MDSKKYFEELKKDQNIEYGCKTYKVVASKRLDKVTEEELETEEFDLGTYLDEREEAYAELYDNFKQHLQHLRYESCKACSKIMLNTLGVTILMYTIYKLL